MSIATQDSMVICALRRLNSHNYTTLRKDMIWGWTFRSFSSNRRLTWAGRLRNDSSGALKTTGTGGSEGAPDSAVFSYMLGRGSFQDALKSGRWIFMIHQNAFCHLQRDAEMSQLGTSSVNFSIFACILTRTVKGGIRFLPAQIGNPKSSCSYKTHTW